MTDNMLSMITPLILTFNEEANIRRTLECLAWAKEVVVVDSGSTDATRNILREFSNVRVFEKKFVTHAEQWNYGLKDTGIRTEWVLALDADYILSEEFINELATLNPPGQISSYQASFKYCVDGVPLRGGIYPPVTVLYRPAGAKYRQDGHTQRVNVEGESARLRFPIYHDDRKPLVQWLSAQARYMALESEKLLATSFMQLGFSDRLRRLVVFAPFVIFFYCYFIRGNILSGKAGLLYSLQRMTAEIILSMTLLRASLGGRRQ